MSWSGFRPSDDQQVHAYNVPVNMYAAAALERALQLNTDIWRSDSFERRARKLLSGIQQGKRASPGKMDRPLMYAGPSPKPRRTVHRAGIERWGVVEVEPSVRVYAYEVDGLGNHLVRRTVYWRWWGCA